MARKRAERAAAGGVAATAEVINEREPGDEDEKQFAPEPNPRSWAQELRAGVKYLTRREPYQAELVFDEKPPQEVIEYVRGQGFQWDSRNKLWKRPESYATMAQDRLVASRTYHKAVEMILQSKGLESEPGRSPF